MSCYHVRSDMIVHGIISILLMLVCFEGDIDAVETTCGPGFGLYNGECRECDYNYFNPYRNEDPCYPRKQSCDPGYGFTEGDRWRDDTCTLCQQGRYSTGGKSGCKLLTVFSCEAGLGYTAGDITKDGSCIPCEAGYYSLGGTSPCYLDGTLFVSKVVSGDDHTCVLTDMGKVYCKGSNRMGQLGLGSQGILRGDVCILF